MENNKKEPITIQYYNNDDLKLVDDFAESYLYEPFDKEYAPYDLNALEEAVSERIGMETAPKEGHLSFLDRFNVKQHFTTFEA